MRGRRPVDPGKVLQVLEDPVVGAIGSHRGGGEQLLC